MSLWSSVCVCVCVCSSIDADTGNQNFFIYGLDGWVGGSSEILMFYGLRMKIAPLGLAGGRSYDRTNSLRTPTMKESQLLREKTTSSVFVSTCSNAVHAQFD